MIRVRKGKVRHRGKVNQLVMEMGTLLAWFCWAIVLPNCDNDITKARYRMESFVDDVLRIAKNRMGD